MPPVPFSLCGLKGKEGYTFGWAREASRTGKFVWSRTANMVVFVLGTSTPSWIMQKRINLLQFSVAPAAYPTVWSQEDSYKVSSELRAGT